MVINYIKILWREMARNKIYAIINVFGLTTGVVGCLLVYLLASYDLSFDTFHPDKERIYRIVGQRVESTGDLIGAKIFPPPLPATIREETAGLQAITGFFPFSTQAIVSPGGKSSQKLDVNVIITDSAYFEIFKYEWLAGSLAAFKEPFKVILSESQARKYFGSMPMDKIIGQDVTYADSLRMSVSGIVKDWDDNTDFRMTDFLSSSTIKSSFLRSQIRFDDWLNSPMGLSIYLKLDKKTSAEMMNSRLARISQNHLMAEPPAKFRIWLEPLSNIHFTSDYNRGTGLLHDDGDPFRKAYLPILYGLMGGALFILIIAAINFINISTARSIRRAKEIGIRKVLGGTRKGLLIQFLSETFMLSVIAVCISTVVINPVLNAFDSFIPDGVAFNPFSLTTLLFLLIVAVITSLFAGLYPAVVLSSYLPALTLRGGDTLKIRRWERWDIRKSLITFQFTISLVFIMSTIVIRNQIDFMIKDPGIPVDNIVTIWCGQNNSVKALAQNIKQLAGVNSVTVQLAQPAGFARMIQTMECNGIESGVSIKGGNEDFLSVYQLKLLAGRNLMKSDTMKNDTLKEFLINETYARRLGFSKVEDALGQWIYFHKRRYPVVGVVGDFHEGSFHEVILPMAIGNMDLRLSLGVRLEGRNHEQVKPVLAEIEKEWKKVYSDVPFVYNYMRDEIDRFYEKELKLSRLVNIMMIITIFISCMGVFGLVILTAEQRAKEIGIRKVLGASVSSIATLLTKELVLLSIIAILVASPIALYFMTNWLQDFAYHVQVSWWMFLLAGLLLLIVALITASFQVIKAAKVSPVSGLRSE